MSLLYLDHFGLNKPPFKITPDTDFFFSGGRRGDTLSALLHVAKHEEGIITVVAEVGIGKTMLSRLMISRLGTDVSAVYLPNPCFSRDEILSAIARDLGLRNLPTSPEARLSALQQELLRRHALGQRVLLVVDEAHAMPPESLEEIRLLSNLETENYNPDTGSNVGNTGRDGLENRVAGGVVPDVTTDCAAQIGTVPYLTLGIARSQALDGYGNFITYRLDMPRGWHRTTTFQNPGPPVTSLCPVVGITTAFAGGFQVNSAPATVEGQFAAVVLISHGANGLGAWNQGNTNNSQNAAPATADELGNTQLNPAGPAAYRAYAYSDVVANPFDDIVSFLTVNDLNIAATKTSRANICS